jgi:hypothetical protein
LRLPFRHIGVVEGHLTLPNGKTKTFCFVIPSGAQRSRMDGEKQPTSEALDSFVVLARRRAASVKAEELLASFCDSLARFNQHDASR